jgi:small-conductance mechanosensitive channel
VINHSLSKPNVRIGIPVQVSYDTDLELAKELMLDAARAHERVIRDELEYLPKVFLRDFADNGIQLELGVWIRDANEGQGNLRSDINWAIWRGFKAAGIEIPFPQRVIHLSGMPAPAINK